MKKQSGFTLIELLLVLAIIGIISAIAIPALLNQRSRARDKAATDNCVSRVGDLVGQWDKARENGATGSAAIALMNTYLKNTTTQDKNPWNTAGYTNAFASTLGTAITAKTTTSAFETAVRAKATAANLGQVQFGYQLPAASGVPGFIGAAVMTQGTGVMSKVSSLE
jgi:type IV pilus assembly protein PilA